MALFPPDAHPIGPAGALAAVVALFWLAPVLGAGDTRETADWTYESKGPMSRTAAGNLTFNDLELRQGSTLLRATRAEATNFVDFKIKDSIWKLAGVVHVEFDGAVLDTQMATVVFADGRLKTIHVQATPTQAPQQPQSPVHLEFNGGVLDAQAAEVTFADGRMTTVQAQGTPAQFSHQLKNSARRMRGRAKNADYDANKRLMRLSGDGWYTDGTNEIETQSLTYNLADGSVNIEAPSRGTFRPDERIPAPRTPDRASAQ
jgi:lipopolysaccharide transport protein LptA